MKIPLFPAPIAAALIVLLGLSGPAISTPKEFNPVFLPSLEIGKALGEIKIDGKLDDAAWRQAGVADDFVERYPGKNLRPDVRTQAFITYDDQNLYVAFNCSDDPSKIRATMCQRDQFDGDDAVCLLIDTYGNAAWAYEFFVNPYGVQKDYLWSNVMGEDESFDLVWRSASQINDSGYQVEMAIPFASMRFPNRDVQTWKIDFWRDHPRESFKQYSWAAYNQDDQCWVCQWGTVNGIRNVKPGKGLEVLPSMVGNKSGQLSDPSNPDSRFVNESGDAELSVGAKYSLSSDLTVETTYNPDFSQIEADAAQIDVNSTIALLYPERRPFFQEGSDIFRTLFNSFYTRTVNDPQFAFKATGRHDGYSIGFMSAYDENTPYMISLEERGIIVNTGKSAVNVLRGIRSLGDNNRVGFIVSDRRFDGGGYGTVVAVDGDMRLSPMYSAVGQFIMSYTREPEDSSLSESVSPIIFDNGKHSAAFDGEYYSGGAFITQLRRRARNWNFTIDYNQVAPSYRTETGYDPWNDYRNFSIHSTYNFYPTKGIFEHISPQVFTENRWNFNDEKKWTHAGFNVESGFRVAQANIGLSYNVGNEKWGGVEFHDLWTSSIYGGAWLTSKIGMSLEFDYGANVARWLLRKGKELAMSAEFELKPLDRLVIEPALSYLKSQDASTNEELFKQFIWRTRFQFQANRQLSIRLVTQYNDYSMNWDIDPLMTYRISSFSVFYIGSTHDITELTRPIDSHKVWEQTYRQYFMKLQYLIRI